MRYVAQRIALGLISLLLLSMMVYAAAQVLPGKPGRIVLGREAPPSAVSWRTAMRRSSEIRHLGDL